MGLLGLEYLLNCNFSSKKDPILFVYFFHQIICRNRSFGFTKTHPILKLMLFFTYLSHFLIFSKLNDLFLQDQGANLRVIHSDIYFFVFQFTNQQLNPHSVTIQVFHCHHCFLDLRSQFICN